MEEVPINFLLSVFTGLEFHLFSWEVVISFFAIIILLFFSAFISASEVSFFSLTAAELENMNSKKVRQLLKRPNELLATILIANNFINVAIVVISTYFTSIAVSS